MSVEYRFVHVPSRSLGASGAVAEVTPFSDDGFRVVFVTLAPGSADNANGSMIVVLERSVEPPAVTSSAIAALRPRLQCVLKTEATAVPGSVLLTLLGSVRNVGNAVANDVVLSITGVSIDQRIGSVAPGDDGHEVRIRFENDGLASGIPEPTYTLRYVDDDGRAWEQAGTMRPGIQARDGRRLYDGMGLGPPVASKT
jgi:hypothetical protein